LTGSQVAAFVAEGERGVRLASLLRFVRLDNAETDELRARIALQSSGVDARPVS
jgi:hypothetical protein